MTAKTYRALDVKKNKQRETKERNKTQKWINYSYLSQIRTILNRYQYVQI